jgi:hypothetical protein
MQGFFRNSYEEVHHFKQANLTQRRKVAEENIKSKSK